MNEELILIHWKDNTNIYWRFNQIFKNEDEIINFRNQIIHNKYQIIKYIEGFIKKYFNIDKLILNIYLINEDKIKINRFKCKSYNNFKIKIQNFGPNYRQKFIKRDSIRNKYKRIDKCLFFSYFNKIKSSNWSKSNIINKKPKKESKHAKTNNIAKETSLNNIINFIKPVMVSNYKAKSSDQNFKKSKFFNLNVNLNINKKFYSRFFLIKNDIFKIITKIIFTKLLVFDMNKNQNEFKKISIEYFGNNYINKNIIKHVNFRKKKNLNPLIIKNIKIKKITLKNFYKSKKKIFIKNKFFKKKYKFKLKVNKKWLKSFNIYNDSLLYKKNKLKKSF